MRTVSTTRGARAEVPVRRRRVFGSRLATTATLETSASKLPVVIRNMSSTGAIIEGSTLPSAGATVILKRELLEQMASVVWSQDGRSGLEFLEPVSLEEVMRLAQSHPYPAKARNTPYYWRSASAAEVPTADEWRAAKDNALKWRH